MKFIVFLLHVGLSAAEPPSSSPMVLRVLTYNIYGILPKTHQPEQPQPSEIARYQEIARRFRRLREEDRAPHLVAMQEAFNVYSEKAAKDSGYPHIVAGAGKSGKIANSGLFILSEFPIIHVETINYKECTGWDCLANKGALHVRITLPPPAGTIDFYTTHMNADGAPAKPEESQKARMAQIINFAAFFHRTRSPDLIAIMGADFNFRPGNEDYAFFAGLAALPNAAESCLNSGNCTGDDPGPIWRDSVDHQFYIPSSEVSLRPIHVAQTFKEPHNGQPLSDHLALETHYLLR